MDIYIYGLLAIVYAILFFAMRKRAKKRLEEMKKSKPVVEMITLLKCEKCNWTNYAKFKRLDYIFGEVKDERAKHSKCRGKVVCLGIYYEPILTPKQIKWQKYEDSLLAEGEITPKTL